MTQRLATIFMAGLAIALSVPPISLALHGQAAAQEQPNTTGAIPPEASSSDIDGQTMFATSCGFCHESGGRTDGKGPKLAGSTKSDEYLIDRIKKGKPGAMPAFGRAFSDGQIMAILAYIRGLDE
jgi:mono/diheme cytochrome c family protein